MQRKSASEPGKRGKSTNKKSSNVSWGHKGVVSLKSDHKLFKSFVDSFKPPFKNRYFLLRPNTRHAHVATCPLPDEAAEGERSTSDETRSFPGQVGRRNCVCQFLMY